MSGNVHLNPGPIFSCSVCTRNVTWWSKSEKCCTCFKWVHLRCSQLSLSKFRTLGSPNSWSCPPSSVPSHNTVTSSSNSCGIPSLFNLALHLLILHSRPTLVFKPLIPLLPILYLFPLPPHHCLLLLTALLRLLPPLPLLPQGSSMECWRSSSQEH